MANNNNSSPTGGQNPIFVYEMTTVFVVFDDDFAADVHEGYFDPDEWERVAWPFYRTDEKRNAFKSIRNSSGIPDVFLTLYN